MRAPAAVLLVLAATRWLTPGQVTSAKAAPPAFCDVFTAGVGVKEELIKGPQTGSAAGAKMAPNLEFLQEQIQEIFSFHRSLIKDPHSLTGLLFP